MLTFLIIDIFTIYPIVIIIHETGHAFFTKVFGGQVKKIIIGIGNKKIFACGIWEVRSIFFLGGQCQSCKLRIDNIVARAFILAGGVIFNIISIIVVNYLGRLYNPQFMYTFNTDAPSILLREFISFSTFIAVFNILPGTYFKMNMDGKQIYQLIKYGSSKLYGNAESQ